MTILSAQKRTQQDMLADLRRDLLEWLLIPTVLASFYIVLFVVILVDMWANLGRQVLVDQLHLTWIAIGAAVGVVGICRITYLLKAKHPRLAAYVYVGGLALIAYILTWFWFSPLSMVLLPPIILLGIAVLNMSASLTLATMTSMVILMTAAYHGQLIPDAVAPLTAVWLTTVTALVSMRNQIRATEWALSSYRQAERKTEEAQKHRGELMRVHKSLDEAYYQLERFTVQLAKAREKAEEALRVKQQFVANVSHELRTPLNIIIGFSETIALSPESYGIKTIPRPLMGDINRIYRSAKHLKGLIDDVLDLSKIDAHQMPLMTEQASLAKIVFEATDMLESIIRHKGLTLTVNIPDTLPSIFLDRLRVRQVLLNLLSNAIRFTETGGITVSVQILDHAVQITVVDTGSGIAPEDMERVFEEFRQLDASLSKHYDGTGLGLALSRRFIELHGGRLWAESEPGEGSCFNFTLPLIPNAENLNQTPSKYLPISDHVKARVGQTILVVTEDPMSSNLLKRHLQGYQIKSVLPKDLPEAVETYLPQAIITNNPIDFEASNPNNQLHHLLQPTNCKVPIINCPLPDPKHLSKMLGVDHYLVKPISREQILAMLADYGDKIKRILIVDDDLQLVELMARFVKAAPYPYTVDIACGGQEGLNRMQVFHPDLVLLDLMMPHLDGTAILKFMKTHETLRTVPVILVTAQDLPQSEIQLPDQKNLNIQMPANFTPAQVLNCLQAILNSLPTANFAAVPEPKLEEIQLRQRVS